MAKHKQTRLKRFIEYLKGVRTAESEIYAKLRGTYRAKV